MWVDGVTITVGRRSAEKNVRALLTGCQHDAHELLIAVLDALEEDAKRARADDSDDESDDESDGDDGFGGGGAGRGAQRTDPSRLFRGAHLAVTTCDACGFDSYAEEAHGVVSVEVPHRPPRSATGGKNKGKKKNKAPAAEMPAEAEAAADGARPSADTAAADGATAGTEDDDGGAEAAAADDDDETPAAKPATARKLSKKQQRAEASDTCWFLFVCFTHLSRE